MSDDLAAPAADPTPTPSADPAPTPSDSPAADPTPASDPAPAADPAAAPDVGAVLNSADWVKHVPADHVKRASKFNTFNDLLKSYGDLETRMGQALFMPGKDAKPEDVARFYQRLGAPKDAAGYKAPEIEGVKWNDAEIDTAREVAHAAGISQAQFEKMLTFDAQRAKETNERAMANHRQAHQKLVAEWGDAAEGNYEMARRAATAMFTAAELKAMGFSDNPKSWAAPLTAALARAWNDLNLAEARHVGRSERDVGKSDADLKAEAADLMRKPGYYQNEQAQKRVAEIFAQITPQGQIGPGSRAA